MTNPPIPPIVPAPDGARSDGFDDVQPLLGDADAPLDPDADAPLDPDADADQLDSAEADRRAATEGTRDGDVHR
jgi:hypothetical protein